MTPEISRRGDGVPGIADGGTPRRETERTDGILEREEGDDANA